MKLHLGCGERFIPGYLHVDAVAFDHVDRQCRVEDIAFIRDLSVDVIYACHVLEHFKRRDVCGVLTEWHRVLKPGGLLRVAVPDFSAICQVYQTTKRLDLVIGPLFGRQDHRYNIHYNAFDLESLRRKLEDAGYERVAQYDWRETDHADVDDFSQAYIPHMDKANGTLISLNVEAYKPG